MQYKNADKSQFIDIAVPVDNRVVEKERYKRSCLGYYEVVESDDESYNRNYRITEIIEELGTVPKRRTGLLEEISMNRHRRIYVYVVIV